MPSSYLKTTTPNKKGNDNLNVAEEKQHGSNEPENGLLYRADSFIRSFYLRAVCFANSLGRLATLFSHSRHFKAQGSGSRTCIFVDNLSLCVPKLKPRPKQPSRWNLSFLADCRGSQLWFEPELNASRALTCWYKTMYAFSSKWTWARSQQNDAIACWEYIWSSQRNLNRGPNL